ncbi:hypothetical protein Mapa_016644 [Marchantia paleacea]|nr:hypothetical protein Mapa_016644 [Marchantia paleacea]
MTSRMYVSWMMEGSVKLSYNLQFFEGYLNLLGSAQMSVKYDNCFQHSLLIVLTRVKPLT